MNQGVCHTLPYLFKAVKYREKMVHLRVFVEYLNDKGISAFYARLDHERKNCSSNICPLSNTSRLLDTVVSALHA